MKDIALFHKVSFDQFCNDLRKAFPHYEFKKEEFEMYYDNIELPTRATKYSVGYDFVTPFDFSLIPGSKINIPTGIRVEIFHEDMALFLMPKSRNTKNSIRMSNTIGVVDPDYFNSSNEGHIHVALEMPNNAADSNLLMKFGSILNKNRKEFHYDFGDQICQGIFLEVGKCKGEDISTYATRDGGFGSTSK